MSSWGSDLVYGAFLQYSPRGESEVSVRSRQWRDAFKRAQTHHIARFAERLAREPQAETLRDRLFGDDVIAIPVPRSAPRTPGGSWPSLVIAEALKSCALIRRVAACLDRRQAVQKSAYAPVGERPDPTTHADSLVAELKLDLAGERLLLVDDFVTRGSTFAGCAIALQRQHSGLQLAAFAAIRTMGLQPEVDRIIEPVVGTIRVTADGGVERSP